MEKVTDSKRITTGRGKSRNRRYTQRRGPLVVHSGVAPLLRGFRNVPGIEFSDVSRLNLLTLAPGGHLGRFIIWTESAFKQLEKIYGNGQSATSKKGFSLPRPILANADISRTISSDEVQSRLFAAKVSLHLSQEIVSQNAFCVGAQAPRFSPRESFGQVRTNGRAESLRCD